MLWVLGLGALWGQAPRTRLQGSVTDAAGGAIPGAEVRLHPADGADQETVTDGEGGFRFALAPEGKATVAVAAAGFAPVSRGVELKAGETRAMEPIALLVSVAEVVTVELPLYDQAEGDMRIEEQQRVVGVLPNFLVSYHWEAVRLTSGQKWRLLPKNLFDPGNLLLIGATAGVQQGLNSFPGYHQGAEGYGKRFGAAGADLVVGSVMGSAVYPSLFRQDPRYFYRGTGSVMGRAWYAATRGVVTRGDSGREQFNVSGVLGDFTAGAVSNLYYPKRDARDDDGFRLTVENGLLGMAGDVLNGLVQEFVLNRLTTHRPAGGGGK